MSPLRRPERQRFENHNDEMTRKLRLSKVLYAEAELRLDVTTENRELRQIHEENLKLKRLVALR